MKTKSRSFLIALLVTSQAACLGFGVVWATGWLWKNFEAVVHDYVVAEGRAVANGIALKTSAMKLGDIQPGTAPWEKLQEVCARETIPHNGFLCFMRKDDGAMLCHPHLEDDPALLSLFPGKSLLMNAEGATPINEMLAANREGERSVVAGKVELNGELYAFSGFSFPNSNLALGVYQSDMAIDLFIASTIRPVMQVGYVLVAFVVGVTAIVTVYLINRYEAGLEEINAKLESLVQERTNSLLRTRNAVTFGLAKLADSRDRTTGQHLERLRSYVTILAAELAKSNPEIDHQFVADLSVASSLHDIGKVGIPDAVLLKKSALTNTERKAMELHTVLGSDCLAAIQRQLGDDDFLQIAQQITAAHHEHWDGSGYPHQLSGKEIPLAARIVSLADVYDALTSERPYKDAMEHAEAKEWIAAQYGQQFDPMVVEAFVAREVDFAKLSAQAREEQRCQQKELAKQSRQDASFSRRDVPVVAQDQS